MSFHVLRTMAVAGVLFGLYACYICVLMNDHAAAWWNFSYGVLASVICVCGYGLWNRQKWAYGLSLVLGFLGVGLGAYLTHFAWTFWIFKQPTFWERIASVFRPQIAMFLWLPLFWIFYFLHPQTRERYFYKTYA